MLIFEYEDLAKDIMTSHYISGEPLPDWDLVIERILIEHPLYYPESRRFVRRWLRDPNRFGRMMSDSWADYQGSLIDSAEYIHRCG